MGAPFEKGSEAKGQWHVTGVVRTPAGVSPLSLVNWRPSLQTQCLFLIAFLCFHQGHPWAETEGSISSPFTMNAARCRKEVACMDWSWARAGPPLAFFSFLVTVLHVPVFSLFYFCWGMIIQCSLLRTACRKEGCPSICFVGFVAVLCLLLVSSLARCALSGAATTELKADPLCIFPPSLSSILLTLPLTLTRTPDKWVPLSVPVFSPKVQAQDKMIKVNSQWLFWILGIILGAQFSWLWNIFLHY